MNFSRLDEHESMNQHGTGLGLSICKSLIELMGGSVRVESQLGIGTTFIMSLKAKSRERAPASKNAILHSHTLPRTISGHEIS